MLFALICQDKPSHLELRLTQRPDHLEYLASLGTALKAAGPFLDEQEKPCGSMIIVEAENLQAAQTIADHDPYARAGLFAAVDIRPWKWLIKNPEN